MTYESRQSKESKYSKESLETLTRLKLSSENSRAASDEGYKFVPDGDENNDNTHTTQSQTWQHGYNSVGLGKDIGERDTFNIRFSKGNFMKANTIAFFNEKKYFIKDFEVG